LRLSLHDTKEMGETDLPDLVPSLSLEPILEGGDHLIGLRFGELSEPMARKS